MLIDEKCDDLARDHDDTALTVCAVCPAHEVLLSYRFWWGLLACFERTAAAAMILLRAKH